MKKLLLLSATALVMAACSESATAPAASRKGPASPKFDEALTCKSGYVIAYDENGNPYCAVDTDGGENLRAFGPQVQAGVVIPARPKE